MKLCRLLRTFVLVPVAAVGVNTGGRKVDTLLSQDPSNWLGTLPSEDSIPIEAIEAEVLALARAAKTKGTREGNIQTFAKQLNRTIQVEMFGQLRNKSRKDMQKLEASRDAIINCLEFMSAAKVVKSRADVEQQFKKYTSSHIECRRKEMLQFEDWNNKKADHKQKNDTKNDLCGALERKRQMFANENDCKVDIKKTIKDQDPTAKWIEDRGGHFAAEVKQYEEEVDACELAKKLEKEASDLMDEAENLLKRTKGKCDSDQNDAMDNECKLRKMQRSGNTAYENCYQPAVNTFEEDAYQVKLNVRKRKLEWRTLERITCLIMALVSADGGQIDAQINFCIRQIYDGHQMNLVPPKVPAKKTLLKEIIAPCTAETDQKFWAPSDILPEFLLSCLKCPLPETAKPTPAPTPPPPPPKFKCQFSAKQTLVHVRYGGFFKKLKKNSFDQWNYPLQFEEWNATSEMEILVANGENNPSLKFKCEYLKTPAFNHKKYKPQWNMKSSIMAPVVASYGVDYDKAQMAQTFWPTITKDGYMAPSVKKPGFGNFIIAPFCDVFCEAKFDDQVLSIMYNGRAITVREPKPSNAAAVEEKGETPIWQLKNKLTKFCFKHEKKATLSAEVFDFSEGGGGMVMTCKSELAAWNDVSTQDIDRMSVATKAKPEDKYKEYSAKKLVPVFTKKTVTKLLSRSMVWVQKTMKDRYVKFTFMGKKID